MKRVDSDALGELTRSLGLTGAGSPITELTDGVVDQVVSVNEIVRRSRTQARSQGIYTAIMRNNHLVANSQTTTVTPFDLILGAIAPYPNPIPAQFDLWLLAATVMRSGGASTTIGATLSLQYDPTQLGWGVDQAGAAVVASNIHTLAFWNVLITSGTTFANLGGSQQPQAIIRQRLPRNIDTTLRFTSSSNDAAVFDCSLLLGLFPICLGQDGIV